MPIALNSGNVWPKNNLIKSNGKIIISILKAINPGMDKEYFLKDLEQKIYNEIDRIENIK